VNLGRYQIDAGANREALLGNIRVLDLADEKGLLCGKILGDLGADVLKIEKPGGDGARSRGPFYHDEPHPEKSLDWFAFNTNKRGITLNIELPEGQELFKELVATADVVVESFPPGYLSAMGLDYESLALINPKIIMTSITAFGQTGPYKDCKSSDITAWAMSGLMNLTGESDRPPLQMGLGQAYCWAGVHAAAATLIAQYHRSITGEGQWIDVSAFECLVHLDFRGPLLWEQLGKVLRRTKYFLHYDSSGKELYGRVIWPCKNGYVAWNLHGGRLGARENIAWTHWLGEEGMAGDLKNVDWAMLDISELSQKELDSLLKPFGRFFLTHTKRELEEGALARGIQLSAVADIRDLLDNEQLIALGYWTKVEHPELHDTILFPGHFFRSSESHSKIGRRAPLIGEHNQEIYEREMGLSKKRILTLRQRNVI